MTHDELAKIYESAMKKKEIKDKLSLLIDHVIFVKNGLVLLKGGKYEPKN